MNARQQMDALTAEALDRCTFCGSCKSRCPTYLAERTESRSARGRLRLVHALENGEIRGTAGVSRSLETCVHCGQCDAVCPAGLDIQERIFDGKTQLRGAAFISRYWLRSVFSGSLMDAGARLLRMARGFSGPSEQIRRGLGILPRPAATPFRKRQVLFRPAQTRGRVALFVGCSVNYLYPDIGEDLVDLLLHLGYEVVLRQGEVCCGAPLREIGHGEVFRQLALKNVETFSKMRVEAVLSACPTCSVMLKHTYPKHVDIPPSFTERIQDVNVFLADRLNQPGDFENRVYYHDPCHLATGLSVREEPRFLLRKTGAELVNDGQESACCGFGGTFTLQNEELSGRIGNEELKRVKKQNPTHLVTACPGCKVRA